MKLLLLVSLILLLGACTFSLYHTDDRTIAIWMHEGTAQATPTREDLPTPTIEVTAWLPEDGVCTAKTNANIRKDTNTLSTVLGSISVGTRVIWAQKKVVPATPKTSNYVWIPIVHGDILGYIAQPFLTCED